MTAKASIIAALPGTVCTIRQETGYAKSFIRRILMELRSQDTAHVGYWVRTTGCPAAVHVAGKGIDAEKINPKTASEACREYRAKVGNPVRKACAGPMIYAERMVPSAISAQRAAFPLAGVWA